MPARSGDYRWADRRWRLGHGRVFALYVALYCLGRLAFEIIRIDDATRILGLRVNIFTSIIIGVAALVYFVVVGRLHPDARPVSPQAAGRSVGG